MTDNVEPEPKLQLILVRAPDDLALASQEFQRELSEFARSLRAQGIQIRSRSFVFDAVGGGGGLSGEFTLVVAILSPVITGVAAVAGAYLSAKYRRKVRVKFGDTEVEVSTMEELEKALHLVEKAQLRKLKE